MRARSMPASLASRRASGEEKMRFVPCDAVTLALSLRAGAAAGCGGGALVPRRRLGRLVRAALRAGEARGRTGSRSVGGFAALRLSPAVQRPCRRAAAAAFTSSPSSASTAISWLTGTSCVPSGTTILASVPSSIASYSIVALSVSISAITSPGLTLSPSFLSHLARLPFSIVGDSAGMRMLTGMTSLSSV